MTKLSTIGTAVPPAPVMRLLSQFSRKELEGFIAVSISLLDVVDGDPDAEEDDPCGVCDEDGVNTELGLAGKTSSGPGCMISDNDYEHDGLEPEEAY